MGSKHGWRYRLAKRYRCPCCDNFTLEEKPPGTFEICPVCGWQDDPGQYDEPDYEGGANDMSLNQARANYRIKYERSLKRNPRYFKKPLNAEMASDTSGLSLQEVRSLRNHKGLLPRIWFLPLIPILIGIIALIWGGSQIGGDVLDGFGIFVIFFIGIGLIVWGVLVLVR